MFVSEDSGPVVVTFGEGRVGERVTTYYVVIIVLMFICYDKNYQSVN